MRFVLASNNAGKLSEFSELFHNMGLTVAPQRDYVTDADETGLSFVENALIKARHASEATGLSNCRRLGSRRPGLRRCAWHLLARYSAWVTVLTTPSFWKK